MGLDTESTEELLCLALLPNELLLHILSCLTTTELLAVTSVCHSLHDLAVRIITHRLAVAAALNGNQLLLECYPPSQRLTEPHLCCTHIGTHGLDESMLDQDLATACPPGELLGKLKNLYSRFQLHRRPRRNINRRNFKGDIPGSRTYVSRADEANNPNAESSPTTTSTSSSSSAAAPLSPAASTTSTTSTITHTTVSDDPISLTQLSPQTPTLTPLPSDPSPEPVIQHAHLDSGVLFAQLCAETTIAMVAPGTNTFIGFQDVSKGVLRVWRNWLAERAAEQQPSHAPNDEALAADASLYERDSEPAESNKAPDTDGAAAPQSKGKERDLSRRDYPNLRNDPRILWVGHSHSVGVRFGVRELKWRRRQTPILMHIDEDAPVSYEIRYDELLVRTSDLLLALERADLRKRVDTGKAIWFGSWTTGDA